MSSSNIDVYDEDRREKNECYESRRTGETSSAMREVAGAAFVDLSNPNKEFDADEITQSVIYFVSGGKPEDDPESFREMLRYLEAKVADLENRVMKEPKDKKSKNRVKCR